MADWLVSPPVHHGLPESYVRPETQRPRLDEVVADADIPVVDLANPDGAAVVAQIGEACRTYGYFQVLNHRVPMVLMRAVMDVAHAFFQLPPEEKAKLYSDDSAKKIRLSTSFNMRKETVHNWRDYLRLHCHPLAQYVPDWPANPPSLRETVRGYSREVRGLAFRLYGAISKNLGLEEEYIKKALSEQEQHMAVHFYPRCPAPELTYGLPAHTDPNALTILLMDPQVPGLQVLKEGRWIAVNPLPNALVITIGDQLQALSTGRYKSGWDRAVVNSDKPWISVASFLRPCNDVVLGPAANLIRKDSPALYDDYTFDEFQGQVNIGPNRQGSWCFGLEVYVGEATGGAKAGGAIVAARAETGGKDVRRPGGGGGKLSAVVGLIAASSAVTGMAAGVISPPVAFGCYLVLLGGLSLVMATVDARRLGMVPIFSLIMSKIVVPYV